MAAGIALPIVLNRGSTLAGPVGSASTPPKALSAWQVSETQLPYAEGFGTFSYAANDLVTVTEKAVTTFARDTGKQLWQVTPPASAGNLFCAVSRNMVNGMVAVAFGAAMPGKASSTTTPNAQCLSTGLLDLATHKFRWVRQLPALSDGATPPNGQALVIAGNYVYAGLQSVIDRVTLTDGAVQTLGQLGENSLDTCNLDDMAVDAETIYLTCFDEDGTNGTDGSVEKVVELAAASGQVTASASLSAAAVKLPPDPDATGGGLEFGGAMIVSTSPLILVLDNENGSQTDSSFIRLDSSLKVVWAQEQPTDAQGQLDATLDNPFLLNGMHDFSRATVARGLLYLVTTYEQSSQPVVNQVVALDVNNGQRRWTTSVPNTSLVDPVAITGNSLLVAGARLVSSNVDNPSTVLATFNATSGALTATREQPLPIVGAASGITLAGDGVDALAEAFWLVADGRLYGMTVIQGGGQNAPTLFSVG
ncbi:MAG TPA: hypothetical protein VHX38_41730 [Pseudonocardiaceae bacterium]|nr:hypothetical protein [Pseudonocardiaceae bacterium]